MSRVGKKPLALQEGVTVSLDGYEVKIRGPKGELGFRYHPAVKVVVDEKAKEIRVEKVRSGKEASSLWGTTARILQNMIEGVTKGFTKKLELQGVGYRMSLQGKKLDMALGFSHPVVKEIPEGITAKVEGNVLTIEGIDKQQVGQFAAEVRSLRPVEPYKGKGFRYVGEAVRRKEGKKAAGS